MESPRAEVTYLSTDLDLPQRDTVASSVRPTTGALVRSSGLGYPPAERTDLTPTRARPNFVLACARASGAAARYILREICTKDAPRALTETRKPPRERGLSVAVPVGFEPTVELPPHMFSRHDPSAARTRYRGRVYTIREARRTTAGRLTLHRWPVSNPRPQFRHPSLSTWLDGVPSDE